ncbi:MAG: patatin-like phospholipase family protein [Halarcobacter sp.]
MKFGLVLGGGAARGAFHLGFLHFLEEQKFNIDTYSGSSIGAIIAVSHASGISAKEQLKIFSSKDIKNTLKFNYFKNGLIKIDSNNPILNELLPIAKLEDLPKKVFINTYDTKKRQLHYYDKGDSHVLCMASSALIPVFKPIKYEHMNLIDGGLFDNLPIKPLLDGEHKICTVDLLPRRVQVTKKRNFNPIKKLKKKIFAQWIDNVNFSILHSDLYITHQNLLNFKMFTFKELNECFDFGYKQAQKQFSFIK